MAKKRITAGMLGGRKKKTEVSVEEKVDEIEKAVAQIHQKEQPTVIETPEPEPIVEEKPAPPKPKPKKRKVEKPVRFSFNMTKDLHKRFKIYCLEKDTSMTDEILMMIQKAVSKRK
jgi:outer membrane biosynthesis protein TonB